MNEDSQQIIENAMLSVTKRYNDYIEKKIQEELIKWNVEFIDRRQFLDFLKKQCRIEKNRDETKFHLIWKNIPIFSWSKHPKIDWENNSFTITIGE